MAYISGSPGTTHHTSSAITAALFIGVSIWYQEDSLGMVVMTVMDSCVCFQSGKPLVSK